MYCPNCGEKSIDEAKFCKDCGGSLTPESLSPPPPIDNHLVWAILATIFCCLPFGIVSIVYAAQVNGLVAEGKFDSARQASENAKMWAWISFGIGIVPAGLFVLAGVYGILGPVELILIFLVGLVALTIALAIGLYVSNQTKRN